MRALLALLLLVAPVAAQHVVCVGDSITAGTWPELLGQRLGPGAAVMNLGVGGATMLRGTDRPYLDAPAWRAGDEVTQVTREDKAFAADAVIVMLGTNDTVLNERRRCWERVEGLSADTRALLDAVQRRFGAPRVLLCSPPPMFPDRAGLAPERAADLRERAPRLEHLASVYRQVAATRDGVDFVDLARVWHAGQVTDGVHPDPFGAAALADRLAEVLRTPVDPAPADVRAALAEQGLGFSTRTYHGFERLDFALSDGTACVLVRPHLVAAGRPWIWRARFFDHRPELDLQLLERGFHLAYCDVAGLYGAPAAVERWEGAFDLFRRHLGLGPVLVLEGLSRGGLPVLSFAAAHPEHVAALVLDNAVCDPRSWPGGWNGKRSDADWTRLLAAHGLSEEAAREDGRGPLHHLEPLASAAIPVHVLIGTADEVVPPAENGERLAALYSALGGTVTVWRKPGLGHHPHGLDPVEPLVRTLLRELRFDLHEPAAFPLASVEYRAGAGWGGDTWVRQVEKMRALAGEHPQLELVFFGDSITQGLTGAGDRLTRARGVRPVDRFGGAISLGLSGDRTEHLMHRVTHGALTVLDPRLIVLQVGVNNVNAARHTGAETAAGLAALVGLLLEAEPQATLLVCGPFPCGHEPQDPRRDAIDVVHARARTLADGQRVRYLDLRPLFLDEHGRPNGLMAGDAIHISAAGQRAWMEAIAPLADELLGR